MSHSQSHLPLQRSLQRLQGAFWRRRFIYWLLRAIWLTLLVPVVILAGYFLRGWLIDTRMLMIGMLVVGGLVILWAVRPISLTKMVQRLDQRLGLQARLMTAFEVTQPKSANAIEDNQVINRLLQETVQITTHVRSQIGLLNRFFWLEIRTLLAVVALLAGLLMLNLLNPRLPNVAPQALPETWQEPSAEQAASSSEAQLDQATPMEQATQQESSTQDSQIRSALEILADALRDQAASRPVAEQIDEGDYAEAAQELRRLADRLDDISRDARQDLGGSMQGAADEIGDSAPEFTEPLQAGSAALANDDLIGGGDALEDLAEVLDSLAETSQQPTDSPQQQEQEESPSEQTETEPEENGGSPSGVQEEQAEALPDEFDAPPPPPEQNEDERLDAEEPLEIESDFELEDRTLQKAELDAETSDKLTQDSPFAKQSLTPAGDLGPDPLSYPWEKREVIRSYFTP